MKRILSSILSLFFVFCAGIGFAGCHHDDKDTDSVTYFGILRKIGLSEDLVVYIPEKGDFIFPEYENQESKIVIKGGHVYNEPLKEGDLIGLKFSTKEIQFQETYPARILTPVNIIYHYCENIKLEKDGEDYLLTMDRDEFSERTFYYDDSKIEIGTTVTMLKALFLTGEGTGSAECGSATIERVSSEQVTFRLNLYESIGRFLRDFALSVAFEVD